MKLAWFAGVIILVVGLLMPKVSMAVDRVVVANDSKLTKEKSRLPFNEVINRVRANRMLMAHEIRPRYEFDVRRKQVLQIETGGADDSTRNPASAD